jgi:hypothetical protein
MITIVNLKDISGRGISKVDRTTALGNPFKGDRRETIPKYRIYLWDKIKAGDTKITAELTRLKNIALKGNLILGCWCTPKACHADVIKSALEWSISKTSKHCNPAEADCDCDTDCQACTKA